MEKLVQNCGKSDVFIKSKRSNSTLFGICHYAGKVREEAKPVLSAQGVSQTVYNGVERFLSTNRYCITFLVLYKNLKLRALYLVKRLVSFSLRKPK